MCIRACGTRFIYGGLAATVARLSTYPMPPVTRLTPAMKSWSFLVMFVLAGLLMACSDPEEPPTPRADHHIHVRSATASQALAQIQRVLGDTSQAVPPSIRADEVVALLDSARIEHGTLLSVAYFFGMPDVDIADEYAKVRAENDFVAEQAAQYPDRLVAFCSVNPKADYALKEMERCAMNGNIGGLKLHLANSDVDLRDSTDTVRLATVVAEANRLGLPSVIHLWTRTPNYGRPDAEIFIDDVLPEAPDIPVQIVHLGGAGVFNAVSDSAMAAFEEAVTNHPDRMENVVFDIGAAAVNPAPAVANDNTAQVKRIRQINRNLARQIETLGAEWFVFGSDYWARQPPDYVETIRALPLDESTVRNLFANTAPYLD